MPSRRDRGLSPNSSSVLAFFKYGLLLLLPSKVADFRMRMFNPDGSEAEACGNGLRCLAKYILYKGLTEAKEIQIETASGKRQVKFRGKRDEVSGIQVSMGKPKFDAKDIPVAIEQNLLDIKPILSYQVTIDSWQLKLDFVSMGNPHAVFFWQKPLSDFPLNQLGPKVENHKLFPNRVNFEIARVINRQQIEVRVWERGSRRDASMWQRRLCCGCRCSTSWVRR